MSPFGNVLNAFDQLITGVDVDTCVFVAKRSFLFAHGGALMLFFKKRGFYQQQGSSPIATPQILLNLRNKFYWPVFIAFPVLFRYAERRLQDMIAVEQTLDDL